jgi:Helix-turn-helix domain
MQAGVDAFEPTGYLGMSVETLLKASLTLGRQLREARLSARLKLRDLARKVKVSVNAVYNCERHDRGGTLMSQRG